MRISRRALAIAAIALMPALASAQEAAGPGLAAMGEDPAIYLEIRKEIEDKIKEIKQDEKAHQEMMEEGRARTVLCKTCHGPDGMSVKEGVPNLAGQNPAYIVDQFLRFGDGRRTNYLMSGLAKSFSKEDKLKIALYFASLPNRVSGGGKPELQAKGKEIFATTCAGCHGADGHGEEGYARLAGQRFDYVVKMLHEFKDRTGRRINPWMSSVALKLSDEEIDAVATYVANLK